MSINDHTMAAGKENILLVLTSHDKLGETGKQTGWYLPEVAHPWKVSDSAAEIEAHFVQ